jgi:OPA family glycerol-3-phosphate transporter-like MFS transporter
LKKETGIRFLFLLCWCSYFCAYIGRLNYSAALTDMIQSEGFGKGEAGLIGTAFFFAYGAGQFVSGFLGDRLPAKWLVFMSLFCSSICNLLMSQSSNIGIMIGVWCVNGLVQALIWSPMLRLVTDYCKAEVRPKLCAALNSAVPVGTMAAYGVTAAVLGMSGWRSVFLLGGGCLFIMSFVWFWGITRVQRTMPVQEKQIPASTAAGAQQNTAGGMDMRLGRILLQSGLVLLLAALFVQGALKDGVTTWIPVYIQETYGVSPILAVAGTMVIPLCNLFGVWLAAAACRHMERNEIAMSAGFFAVCSAALMVLWLSSGKSMAASMGMLALSTTTMMTVNTLLTAVLPSCFGRVGKASSMSGLLNSAVYSGGAVSAYGIGSMAGYFGWTATILIWAVMAAVSVLICGIAAKKWGTYRRKLAGGGR